MFYRAAIVLMLALSGCEQTRARGDDRSGATASPAASEKLTFVWPPVVGQSYPDLELPDQEGMLTRLSSFRGKVVLLEPIGTTCKACNAFSGGDRVGGFRNVRPQPGLGAIEEHVQRFAGVSMDHPELVFVQVLFYGSDGRSAPSLEEGRAWAAHFGFERSRRQVVLTADQRFIGRATRRMVPGFQLIDRRGVLVADGAGNRAPHDIYRHLLPMLGRLLGG